MKRTIPLFASAIALFTLIAPAQAHEEGQWIIRAGLGSVAPDSKNLDLSDAVDTITVEVDSGNAVSLFEMQYSSSKHCGSHADLYMFSRNITEQHVFCKQNVNTPEY